MMIDQLARGVLLLMLAMTFGVWVQVLRRTRRPSRRGSIWAMFPTLILWLVFEVVVMIGGDIGVARWLSRLGVISLTATILYQLWSIDYAEHTEQSIRENGL